MLEQRMRTDFRAYAQAISNYISIACGYALSESDALCLSDSITYAEPGSHASTHAKPERNAGRVASGRDGKLPATR